MEASQDPEKIADDIINGGFWTTIGQAKIVAQAYLDLMKSCKEHVRAHQKYDDEKMAQEMARLDPHFAVAVEHSIEDPFTGEATVKVRICDHAPGEPCTGHTADG